MKKLIPLVIVALTALVMLPGCFSATQATVIEYDATGNITRTTVTSESVIKTLTESTKNKTVIAWESGWMAYLSMSAATTEDPTPTVKMFAGKSDKGMISAMPDQKHWDGISKAIQSTKQDLSVTTEGFSNTSSTIQE